MAIPLMWDTTAKKNARFGAADPLEVDSIDRRSGSGNMDIGSNLAAGEELQIASAAGLARVMGNLKVDGELLATSVVSLKTEEVRAQANYIMLNDGYTSNTAVEGGIVVNYDPTATNDTVNGSATAGVPATSNPTVVTTGSGTFSAGDIVLWTGATDESNNGLYEVHSHSGTTLTLRGVGTTATTFNFFDTQLVSGAETGTLTLVNVAVLRCDSAGNWETAKSASTGTMSFVDLAAGAGNNLQQTYESGNTIAVTSAEGVPTITNDTNSDTTTCLAISRSPSSSTAGIGLSVALGANTTGIAAQINQSGSGDALLVQDGGGNVLQVTGAGAVNVTPTSGQNASVTAGGAGIVDIDGAGGVSIDASNGELTFDDVGNSGLTLSQSSDRTIDQTAGVELYAGVTSLIGALNAISDRIDVNGGPVVKEAPIENTQTITAGDVVAVSTTSGRVRRADANSNTVGKFVGIAMTGGTGDAGGTVICRIAMPGCVVTDSGASFTAGSDLFMPDGTGRPTHTPPSGTGDLVKRVGWAITSTQYFVESGVEVIL